MILGINSAGLTTTMALTHGDKILEEVNFMSAANEASKMLPWLQQVIPNFTDLERIVCVVGPGSYTGLRIGITITNAFAFDLKIPITTLNLFQYWRLGLKEEVDAIIFNAGRDEVYYQDIPSGAITIKPLATVKGKIAGEILDRDKDKIKLIGFNQLKTFGQIIQEMDFSSYPEVELAEPLYIREPDIN